ncbi:ATPase, partial [Vibrio parahaemolyticus]
SEVRALLRHNNLEVVEDLVKQQVLGVTGSQEEVDKLSTSEAVEYTEKEQTRKLLSQ